MRQDPDNIIGVGSHSHLLRTTFSHASDIIGLIASGQNLVVHFVDQNNPVSDLMKTHTEEALKAFDGKAHMVEIDIAAQPHLAESMMTDMHCPPEIQLFSQGSKIDCLQGLHHPETLLHTIQDAFDRQQFVSTQKRMPIVA